MTKFNWTRGKTRENFQDKGYDVIFRRQEGAEVMNVSLTKDIINKANISIGDRVDIGFSDDKETMAIKKRIGGRYKVTESSRTKAVFGGKIQNFMPDSLCGFADVSDGMMVIKNDLSLSIESSEPKDFSEEDKSRVATVTYEFPDKNVEIDRHYFDVLGSFDVSPITMLKMMRKKIIERGYEPILYASTDESWMSKEVIDELNKYYDGFIRLNMSDEFAKNIKYEKDKVKFVSTVNGANVRLSIPDRALMMILENSENHVGFSFTSNHFIQGTNNER